MPQFQNHVFISYSYENNNDVNEFYAICKTNFVDLTIWKDTEECVTISKDLPKINKAIKASRLVLCFISKAYFNSEFCCNQFKLAYSFNKEIILILLEDISFNGYIDEIYLKKLAISRIYKNRHKPSLWMGYHFEKLLEYISFSLDMNLTSSETSEKHSNSIFKYFENHYVSERKLKDPLWKAQSYNRSSEQQDEYNGTKYNELEHYNEIKSIKSLKIKSVSHGKLCSIPNTNRLILTDEFSRELKIVDLDGNFIKSFNPENVLVKPSAICINSRNQILIGDKGCEGIFIFDSHFEFLVDFGKNLRNTITYICSDPTNSALIYVSHCSDNELTVWNIDQQKIISSVQLDRPDYIFVKNDKIYVTSSTCYELHENKKHLSIKYKFGSNCIYVLDKSTLNLINTIKFDDWLQPAGLYVDSNENILTTAFITNGIKTKSESRYLFHINENGSITEKICLNDIKNFDDMIVYENKAIFYIWQALKVIEFK